MIRQPALSAPILPADGPDYETAARALGFVRLPTGNWAHPSDGQHMDMIRFYRSAEEIFYREQPSLLRSSCAGMAEPVAISRTVIISTILDHVGRAHQLADVGDDWVATLADALVEQLKGRTT